MCWWNRHGNWTIYSMKPACLMNYILYYVFFYTNILNQRISYKQYQQETCMQVAWKLRIYEFDNVAKDEISLFSENHLNSPFYEIQISPILMKILSNKYDWGCNSDTKLDFYIRIKIKKISFHCFSSKLSDAASPQSIQVWLIE